MSVVEEGKDVLLYLNDKVSYMIRAKKGQVFHTHKGFIRHDDLIGKRYGDRVKSSMGVDFVILNPTTKDYGMKVERKTQIIYPKDAGLILLYTGIGPGSRVVEAGMGTGVLTGYLAHFVRPNGKVYSYEIREEFIKLAMSNLERAGLLKFVEVKRKDITKGIDERDVDAVILDLATPWLVIEHAYNALKGGGAIASFSPTIDQVIKTVNALRMHGFVNIETVECLLRRIRVEEGKTRPETLMIGHTGYLTFARKAFKEQNE